MFSFSVEDLYEAAEIKLQSNFEDSYYILTLTLALTLSGTAQECTLSHVR